MTVFMKEQGKNKLVTQADWRVRPLHPDMLKYAALDSFLTLKVFYLLYNEVYILE